MGSIHLSNRLSKEQFAEIAELLAAGITQSEIAKTYGISPGAVSRLHTRLQADHTKGSDMGTQNGVYKPSGLAVTVDKQGIVLSVERAGPQLPLFEVDVEVVTTATRQVRAASLEEAIHRARTGPDVRRVTGVREVKPQDTHGGAPA